MKHKTWTIAVALILAMALLCACAPSVPEPATKPQLRVATLKGPTGMGMAQMMQAAEAGETAVAYTFALAGAPDEISAQLMTGEADIAAAPINLAAILYNKTQGEVVMIAINTLGVLYIVENGEEIQEITDLAGKTLYATGQSATPEYVINYLLEKNGIAGQVAFQYMGEHAELAALLVAEQARLAMLPEPNVTTALMKNGDLRVALDLTEEWNKVSNTQLVQGCILVRKEVLETDPEAVNTFLAEYAASTRFVNENPAQAAEVIAQYEILPNAAAAQAALPACNIVCITGEEMAQSAGAMLQVLYEANPKSVGGALPGDDLYYLK